MFGYTPLDPLVVLIGTGLAAWFLTRKPLRLLAFMPAALSLYFFIPMVTYLTLWQTVPMLLTARVFLLGKLTSPSFTNPVLAVAALSLAFSASYAMLTGDDSTRVVIRLVYYLGIFSLFSFCYEVGRRPEALQLLLRGLVAVGVVYSVYGAYQILASQIGLPMRGILRGTDGVDIAYEFGFIRVNSLANEPKRLGYVLFCAVLACFALAKLKPARSTQFYGMALFILSISLFTFAGSYFLALAIFAATALLLYPSKTTGYVLGLISAVGLVVVLFPDLGLIDAVEHGYERRAEEIEIGLDGAKVYRQEFFAWDYLSNHPGAYVSGLGLGQYFTTLNREYGIGVGINEYGGLQPLNSTFLEMTFDLGGVVATLFYAALAGLIWKLRQAGESFLCLALLFVTIQSLTILTLQFVVLFAGVGVARLQANSAYQTLGSR